MKTGPGNYGGFYNITTFMEQVAIIQHQKKQVRQYGAYGDLSSLSNTPMCMTLVIKYELMQGGYLTAVLKNGAKEKRVAADIFIDKHTNTDATSVSIKGGTPASITEELFTLLREPVEALSAVVSKGASV